MDAPFAVAPGNPMLTVSKGLWVNANAVQWIESRQVSEKSWLVVVQIPQRAVTAMFDTEDEAAKYVDVWVSCLNG